jgi:hypothetical protein
MKNWVNFDMICPFSHGKLHCEKLVNKGSKVIVSHDLYKPRKCNSNLPKPPIPTLIHGSLTYVNGMNRKALAIRSNPDISLGVTKFA